MKKIKFLVFCLVTLKAGAQPSALAIADSLYSIGNYTNAINYYAKVGTTNADLQIARTYNAIRNYDKAITEYEAVITSDKKAQIPKYELGKLYLKTKKALKAKFLFEELVTESDNNPEYYYYLANSVFDLDSVPKSMRLFKKAIAIDSTHLRSIYEVSKFYTTIQERDSVVKYVDKGLQFYDQDVSLINLKAIALYNNDEYSLAIPLFEKLIELKEEKSYIFERLANAYFRLDKFEKAKENYKKVLEFDEEKANTLFSLGNVFWKQQQLDSAAVYIQKSIDVQLVILDKEYQALGRLASEQNDYKLALKYYKLAHEQDPSNVIYFYQICVLSDNYYKDPLMKLNNYEQLITIYGEKKAYFSDYAKKRISELKEEIHFAKD